MIIQFDVDGVLADFIEAFTREAGFRPPISTLYRPQWDLDDMMNPTLLKDTWRKVANDSNWWERLSPLVSPLTFETINELSYFHNVVFVTDRFSYYNAQHQTLRWLIHRGIETPSVVVSKRKGEIAAAIGADYCIDDRPENAACVRWMADRKPCKSYLLNRPYNQVPVPSKVKRVNTVDEFINDIKGGL